jgi:hypothetical protein
MSGSLNFENESKDRKFILSEFMTKNEISLNLILEFVVSVNVKTQTIFRKCYLPTI